MQFIEKNSFNLRAAVYSLKKDSTALEFVVFPMIHVGSREYYQEITRRLSTCDLILVEGLKSKKATILTLSYRFIKKIRRMDLITQHEGIRLDEFRNEIKNTDMEENAFDERWSSLPITLRLQLFILVPFWVLYLFLFGTRETLAENLALEICLRQKRFCWRMKVSAGWIPSWSTSGIVSCLSTSQTLTMSARKHPRELGFCTARFTCVA